MGCRHCDICLNKQRNWILITLTPLEETGSPGHSELLIMFSESIHFLCAKAATRSPCGRSSLDCSWMSLRVLELWLSKLLLDERLVILYTHIHTLFKVLF